MNPDLLQAVNLATGGNWDAAHRLVQEYEEDPMAAWIHAVLHKIEGDRGNSRYWYRCAGKLEYADADPAQEWDWIKAALAESGDA